MLPPYLILVKLVCETTLNPYRLITEWLYFNDIKLFKKNTWLTIIHLLIFAWSWK